MRCFRRLRCRRHRWGCTAKHPHTLDTHIYAPHSLSTPRYLFLNPPPLSLSPPHPLLRVRSESRVERRSLTPTNQPRAKQGTTHHSGKCTAALLHRCTAALPSALPPPPPYPSAPSTTAQATAFVHANTPPGCVLWRPVGWCYIRGFLARDVTVGLGLDDAELYIFWSSSRPGAGWRTGSPERDEKTPQNPPTPFHWQAPASTWMWKPRPAIRRSARWRAHGGLGSWVRGPSYLAVENVGRLPVDVNSAKYPPPRAPWWSAGLSLVLTGACQLGHGVGGFTTNFIHSC